MGLLAVVAYLCLVGAILYSSLKHREPGWRVGFVLGLFLLTIPLWAFAICWIFGLSPK
jgi:hypothetical protein